MSDESISTAELWQSLNLAEQWLGLNRDGINAINVYPVPDGDTGTNMLLTWRQALDAVGEPPPESVGEMLAKLSRGALLGARGNSGVILSQMIGGLASALESAGESISVEELAAGFQNASDNSYRAITEPVEGTMLTVMREAASKGISASEKIVLLEDLVAEAFASVERTPQLLPKLAEAGVVDSGGMGVAIILQGMKFSLLGQNMPDSPVVGDDVIVEMTGVEHEGYGYCTEFVVLADIELSVLEEQLLDLGGESILVVGEPGAIRVHVHMEDPGPALTAAVSHGETTSIKIDNMQLQHEEWAGDRSDSAVNTPHAVIPTIGLVSVARGAGLVSSFRDLGAGVVLDGGPTGKASAGELLEAASGVGQEHVILLPNDKDVILAAEQAASNENGFLHVIPTTSVVQGMAAALAYLPEGDIDEIVAGMTESAEEIRSVEISTSVRTTSVNGIEIQEGEGIGLLDGVLVASAPDLVATFVKTLEIGDAQDAEILTVYTGEDVSDADIERLTSEIQGNFSGVELDIVDGGQPLYPFVASLE